LTAAPNTARAAIVMPAPTATMIIEWPKEKKNRLASGRFQSAISLRVVLSMQEMRLLHRPGPLDLRVQEQAEANGAALVRF
jgi:hypothetical protein